MKNVTSSTFEELVATAKGLIVVDFWASWCPPCRAMDPILNNLSVTLSEADKMTFYKVDMDVEIELGQTYDVRSIPTLLVFQGGQVIKSFIGAVPKTLLEESLKNLKATL